MLVDVSSDIKRRGEGSGLDVITQGSCCRQKGWRGGVGCGGGVGGCYEEQAKPAVRQNNDFRLSLQCMAMKIISAVQHRAGNKERQTELL